MYSMITYRTSYVRIGVVSMPQVQSHSASTDRGSVESLVPCAGPKWSAAVVSMWMCKICDPWLAIGYLSCEDKLVRVTSTPFFVSTWIKSSCVSGPVCESKLCVVQVARSISSMLVLSKASVWAKADAKARQVVCGQVVKKSKLWCEQLCSARNRRKIFAETSCALIISRAIIHHTMLCQLRLHSSSRCFCSCN